MHKLIGQARLAHPRLTHESHHLAVPGLRLRQTLAQGIEFVVPPHKARQPPRRGGLQAAPQRGDPVSSNTAMGSNQALDGDGPQGSDPHQPFYEPEGAGGQRMLPRRR